MRAAGGGGTKSIRKGVYNFVEEDSRREASLWPVVVGGVNRGRNGGGNRVVGGGGGGRIYTTHYEGTVTSSSQEG